VVDCATSMADLPELRDYQFSVTEAQMITHRKGGKVDLLCCNIFCEVAGDDIKALCTHEIDAFLSEKADLSVPFASMRVSFNAKT